MRVQQMIKERDHSNFKTIPHTPLFACVGWMSLVHSVTPSITSSTESSSTSHRANAGGVTPRHEITKAVYQMTDRSNHSGDPCWRRRNGSHQVSIYGKQSTCKKSRWRVSDIQLQQFNSVIIWEKEM